jgi:tRNA A-37 threonylcarbamoyl transferase component Bud32
MQRASRHVRVPHVRELRGDVLVLEKIDGPTMEDDLRIRPWMIRPHARLLASLHEQVAQTGLAHMDLAPSTVVLSPDGPVLVDWTNAREGDHAIDVALTYVILMTGCGVLGRLVARSFARLVDVRAGLERAAAFRAADARVTARERARVARLLEAR